MKKREGRKTAEMDTVRQRSFQESSCCQHVCGTWAMIEGAREGVRAQDTAQMERVCVRGEMQRGC